MLDELYQATSELTRGESAAEPQARSAVFGLALARFAQAAGLLQASETSECLREFHQKLPLPFVGRSMQALLDCAEARFLQQPLSSFFNGKIPGLFELCGLYEHFLKRDHIKREGIFYTPYSLVQEVCGEVVAPMLRHLTIDELCRFHVLDPACGTGIFLLEAFALIRKRLQELGCDELSTRLQIASTCLYGVDKDSTALEIAAVLLRLATLDLQPTGVARPGLADLAACFSNSQTRLLPALFHGNALLDVVDARQLALADIGIAPDLHAAPWSEYFSPLMQSASGGFDCIIGNPPYGLSRDEQLSPQENALLKRTYQEFRNGKVNKYLAFLARGYQLLGVRGTLGFIVPNAWLGIRGGMALRKRFLEERSIEKIILCSPRPFEGAIVETVVVKISKHARCKQIIIARNNGAAKALSVPVDVCLRNPDCTIPLVWSDDASRLFEHLDSIGLPLNHAQSHFTPAIALQAYARGKGIPPQSAEDVKRHVFHRSFKEDPATLPYLVGADVARYQMSWSGSYLKYGPWLAEPQELSRFQGPRLLVREILGPMPSLIQACYVDDTFLYNKSILHIFPRPRGSRELLWALLAILNSPLASVVIRYRGRKSQRSIFPKLVNDDLKSFPLPRKFEDFVTPLSRHAQRLTQCVKQGEKPEILALIEKEVHGIILDAYEFTNSLVSNFNKLLNLQ